MFLKEFETQEFSFAARLTQQRQCVSIKVAASVSYFCQSRPGGVVKENAVVDPGFTSTTFASFKSIDISEQKRLWKRIASLIMTVR